jgi:MSHA biogenesis protein MshP
MRPNHLIAAQCQRGFAIMAALVILVVLASLGAYMVNISSSQHIGSALDIEGGRALQAARAGLDWGIEEAVNNPTAFGGGNCQTGQQQANLSFPAITGYTVSVTCSGTSYTDGSSLYSYAITATACNQSSGGTCPNITNPNNFYVERRLTAQVVCNATGTC